MGVNTEIKRKMGTGSDEGCDTKAGQKRCALLTVVAGVLFLLVTAACGITRSPMALHTIGDSTMADKKPEVYPETGWCQAFPRFAAPGVTLHNHAVNGRSTKSFINEGRWQQVLDTLKQGDYVFIQFGHNDQKIKDTTRYAAPHTTYKANLERFVRESRAKGATPILFTSIVRRKFDEQGNLTDTHGDYPAVVRQVARELQLPLVDLQQRTEKLVLKKGAEKSKRYYLWTPPEERFPEGRKDDTHLNREGARVVARLAAKELRKMKIAVVR